MPSDTKTALLDAAEQAARAQGFDGFSYADLASSVGIRKASIHHHFPTKAALSQALIARYHAKFEATCADLEASHPTGGARLSALIQSYRDALQDGRSLCLCVSFSTSRDSLPPEALTQIAAFRAMMLSWLQASFTLGKTDGTIAHVQAPNAEAAAALPLLEGAQLTARATRDVTQFDQAIQLMAQRLS